MKSTHIPELAGTTVAVTGTLVVDTGLRNLQSFVATLAQDAVATAASLSWALVARVAGESQKVTIKTWKADGATAGDTAANVSWLALGK